MVFVFSLPRSEKWSRSGERLGEKQNEELFFSSSGVPSVASFLSVLRTSIFATEFKSEFEEYCLHSVKLSFLIPEFAFSPAETR